MVDQQWLVEVTIDDSTYGLINSYLEVCNQKGLEVVKVYSPYGGFGEKTEFDLDGFVLAKDEDGQHYIFCRLDKAQSITNRIRKINRVRTLYLKKRSMSKEN